MGDKLSPKVTTEVTTMDLPQANNLEPPYETIGDIVAGAGRGAIELVTFGGATPILRSWFSTSYENRLEHWRVEVVNRILRLEREGLTIESLQNNQQFLSALAQAAESAAKTHEQDKRDALTNAVINSGLVNSPEDTKQQIFLLWLDSFTGLHIRLLRFLQRPPSVSPRSIIGGSNILNRFEEVIPNAIRDAAVDDLRQRQLSWVGGSNDNRSRRHTTGYTTVIGDEFLDFIEEK